MNLGVEGQRVGGAVSWSRADGANALGGGLESHGWPLVESVLLSSEEERSEWLKTVEDVLFWFFFRVAT